VRVVTTNAVGSDSMIGVDNISITDGAAVPAEPVATCPATLRTTEGSPTSVAVSATDADSDVVSATIVSAPIAGITLTPTGPGAATLDVDGSLDVGVHPVDIEFATDDDPVQTVSCTVQVQVAPDPATITIGDIQGSGPVTPIPGIVVTVDGTVTSLFTSNDVLDGYFIQDEGDGDLATSDGIFVFCRGGCPTTLATGDNVVVTGSADENFDMTQLTARSAGATTIVSSGNALPAATTVDLPAAGSTATAGTFETTEGMLVTIPQTLAVSEYFELARYGQIELTVGGRPDQFTDTDAPSVEGYAAHRADLARRTIILDDDNNTQNDAVTGPVDEPYPWPAGGLSVDNRVRGGDTITGLTGVLHWSFAGQTGTDAWRIRPVVGVDYTFTTVNPAPELADVGGDLRVASFNVLNYFTTIDETQSNDNGTCGPTGLVDCRGADSVAELDAQRAKIVDAIVEIDPAVAGLIEIQNDEGQATDDLVAGLNAATALGTYDAIDTGFVGTDAIRQAFVYQPGLVTPAGDLAILDSTVDPTFIDTENRPVLVQTFEEVATGERFTVAVNHFKSKGSDCNALGDPDLDDGAGNCNVTRTAAANALADFLATDPTGSGDPDVLVIGDLNSYRMEDPITALRDAGYIDLVAEFEGDDAYSYVFDGQLGYLDHALANEALRPQVTGVTTWHINADEIPIFDYNDGVDDEGESSFERESNAADVTDSTALRSSDHDPVVIGLDLGEPVVDTLRIDDALLTFSKRLPGVAILSGGIDETRAACPTLSLSVDGTEVTSVRTVRLLGLCVGLGRGGLVTFDLHTSNFGVIGVLPRGFTVADADVDVELVLDGTSYSATVAGTLRPNLWTAN